MAPPYDILTRTETTLAADMAQGANSATLASAAFGTPTYKVILTIDYDVAAKSADYECTVNGTAVTSMTLLNGPNVAHTATAKVSMNFVDEHYTALRDGIGLAANAVVKTNTALVDNAGASAILGRVGGTGNYWRLQIGTASIVQDGINGYATFAHPVALASLTGSVCVATLVGHAAYTGPVAQSGVVDTSQSRARVSGVTSGTVQFMVWGQTAS